MTASRWTASALHVQVPTNAASRQLTESSPMLVLSVDRACSSPSHVRYIFSSNTPSSTLSNIGTSCAPFLSGLTSEAKVSTLLRLLSAATSPLPSPDLFLSYNRENTFCEEPSSCCRWPQGTLTCLAGDAHDARRSRASPSIALKHLEQGHMRGACAAGLALAS